MIQLYRVEFVSLEEELAPELASLQGTPRTVLEVLTICRDYRVHAVLSDAAGTMRGKIDPDGGYSPT
jgi:hypothetical protein